MKIPRKKPLGAHLSVIFILALLLMGSSCAIREESVLTTPEPEVSATPSPEPETPPPTPSAEPEAEAESEQPKTLAILGDSYSAFKGYVQPETNVCYYPISDAETEGSYNDVEQIGEMWWVLFAERNGYEVAQNDSYSGSPMCYDGFRAGREDAASYSYVTRCRELSHADLILIEGATNDSFAGAAVGEYQYSDWEEADFTAFRPACAYVLSTLRSENPSATIIFILNSGLRSDIVESVDTICAHYEVPVLHLSGIAKQNNHPNVEGMKQICEQLELFLEESEG